MTESQGGLGFICDGWQNYSEKLGAALAPLTAEQLDLRAGPELRSIREIALHVIAVRARWFAQALHEGDAAFAAIGEWDRPGSPTRTGAELADGLTATWTVLRAVVLRYTPADLTEVLEEEYNGQIERYTRGWVIWHVIEHDLHHGGEIAYSLGIHGLAGPDID